MNLPLITLPRGAVCDRLNVFSPHFPELIELFVHNLFYFHRALNYSETLKYFIAHSGDLDAVGSMCDEFSLWEMKRERGPPHGGEHL